MPEKVSAAVKRISDAAKIRFGPQWQRAIAEASGWKVAALRTLVYRAKKGTAKKMPPADRLRALEEAAGLVPAQSLRGGESAHDVQPRSPFADMTPDEEAVYFPLLRAIMDLARRHDEAFEHLVKQTQLLLRVEGRASHPALDLALKTFRRVRRSTPAASKAGQAKRARRARPRASRPRTQ